MNAYEPYTLVAGRILLTIIFLVSGIGKLADPSGTMREIASVGLPFPLLAYVVALVCELGGGLAILVGFHARIAAAVLTAYTLVAALAFHAHFADPNQTIHFLKNLAMAGGLLYVVARGAGALSVDAFAVERRTAVSAR